MEQNNNIMADRVKCIYCEMDNFSKDTSDFSELVVWCHELNELDRLSVASGQDYLSVICHKCCVSLFLGTFAAMIHKDIIKRCLNENMGHEMMSKVLFEILGKYNRSSRILSQKQAMGLSIDNDD